MSHPAKHKDKKLARKILTELAIGKNNKTEIANKNHINYSTLIKILEKNQDEYKRLTENLKEKISVRALLVSEKCIKRIKKDKIDESSALSLSMTAKNLMSLENPSQNLQINFLNIPKNKEDIISDLLNYREKNILENPEEKK